MDERYGAAIERGEIIYAVGTHYVVKSLSRDGIESPPIPALPLVAEVYMDEYRGPQFFHKEYAAGDRVYFFLFGDGQGMILAAID